MGLINKALGLVLGGGGNALRDTVQVFRPNAEASAQRGSDYDQTAMAQFASEFQFERKGLFDRFMDGLNRLPRPLFVLSIFWLFSLVVIDPIYFAEVMTALALVPTPLWYGAGTIMGFYFGGRMQSKMFEARKEFATVANKLPAVLESIQTIRALRSDSPGAADTGTDARLAKHALDETDNLAVAEWRKSAGE